MSDVHSPDDRNCEHCGRPLHEKAARRFCSAKCRSTTGTSPGSVGDANEPDMASSRRPVASESLDTVAGGAVTSCAPKASQTRTSGSKSRVCRLCGQEIQGRLRNGFCGDRCRMQFRRREERARMEKLFVKADAAFDALRREVLGIGQRGGGR